jgi:hypothetical protein
MVCIVQDCVERLYDKPPNHGGLPDAGFAKKSLLLNQELLAHVFIGLEAEKA